MSSTYAWTEIDVPHVSLLPTSAFSSACSIGRSTSENRSGDRVSPWNSPLLKGIGFVRITDGYSLVPGSSIRVFHC